MITESIRQIRKEIGTVSLVVVSKARTIDEIRMAVNSGARIIAENKLQEAEKKHIMLKNFFKEDNVEFHFIGKLQKNKAKKAVILFDLIQSIDTFETAKEVDKRASEINKVQRVLLEVNIGKEMQKSGFIPDTLDAFISELPSLKNLYVEGLMCIPPFSENPEDSRPYFKEMKSIFLRLKKMKKQNFDLQVLSMGMSNDYIIAIEEGSNMVRIGTLVFGERDA